MVLVAVKPLAVSYMICGFRRLTIAEDEARDESRGEGRKEGKVRDDKVEARDGSRGEGRESRDEGRKEVRNGCCYV